MRQKQRDKKLLILGGNSTEIEIIIAAKKMGIYTIVTDYNTNWKYAPAKYEADEVWNIDWTDLELLVQKCKEHKIDGIMAGFSEKRVSAAHKLSSLTGLPFYTNGVDLNIIFDKINFKEKCIENNIKVPKSYDYSDEIDFPVIVKPADSGGSQGITICYTNKELEKAYQLAMNFSNNKRILIEEYIVADEVMIYYIVHDGNITLSAMCDRVMKRFDENITQLPTAYYFPSKYLSLFMEKSDEKFKNLIKRLGIKNGLIAFQSFSDGKEFIPFDPTYRLDGTLSYHLTEYINDINVLEMLINYSLTGNMGLKEHIIKQNNPKFNKIGFQLPILLTKGTVTSIIGLDQIMDLENVIYIQNKVSVGDVYEKVADFSQIAVRIFMVFDNEMLLTETINKIYSILDFLDEKGKSMMIGKYKFER